MASFTARPVKDCLPTLSEIREASPEELHRFQAMTSAAIADELAEVVEQLKPAGGARVMAADIRLTRRGGWHRPAPQPLRRELAHVLRRRQGLVSAEGLVLLAWAEGLSDIEIRSLVQGWEDRPWPRR
ncbi:MAG: hypothetical protein M3256_06605 [Actinomycetota bacterium]|jgi:hypothetical protein|nr:hypothetical protein [Candidatus Dormibacteraeota bacterium]MDQ6945937.1 hypothetical protein [Actinomycetota bacterium]